MCLYAAAFASLVVGVTAENWAVLAAGSKTYSNYRHQADVCGVYQLLRSKGFSEDKIITMAYDDIANNTENPFPGKIFNAPDGEDVYHGCKLDYTGESVTPANFAGVLRGNKTTGGTGRVLNSTSDDHVFVFYEDHGAPGLFQFPNDEIMHATAFQELLKQMHDDKRFSKMAVYIGACESGSMLENFPTNLSIYGVTAVGPDKPSLGTYCGSEAQVNGTNIGSCLGDMFPVFWKKFIAAGNGTATMQDFFTTVSDNVASYASLHYGSEQNQQYGDLSIAKMYTSDFFYPQSASAYQEALPPLKPVKLPASAYSAPRLDMDRLAFLYSEAASLPTYRGKVHAQAMKQASKALKELTAQQEKTQDLYWELLEQAVPNQDNLQEKVWLQKLPPHNAVCEITGHNALLRECKGYVDLTSSFALQFHQVMVNLCARTELGWGKDPSKAEAAARAACEHVISTDSSAAVVLV